MLCVECGSAVAHVYREFSAGNIRLTLCELCGSFADQYVEFEPILLFLDLVLLKRAVYRHCLYNVERRSVMRALFKLLPAFLCLDVYLQWLRLWRFYGASADSVEGGLAQSLMQDAQRSALSQGVPFVPPLDRHSTMILLQAASTAVYWLAITVAARVGRPWLFQDAPSGVHPADKVLPPAQPSAPLLGALMLSSFGKFFALLPLVWSQEYEHVDLVARGIRLFVIMSNVRAVSVQTRTSDLGAAILIAVGLLVQTAFLACCRSEWDPTLLPMLF